MNKLERQITLDGHRNVVVKLTGVLDTSDISEIAIAVADCTNNDPNLYLKGFRVDMLEYSIGQGLEVQLYWDSNNPQQIYPLAGRGKIFAWSYGGYIPDTTRSGYTGSIALKTTGFGNPGSAPVQNFTISLELVKLYWRSHMLAM